MDWLPLDETAWRLSSASDRVLRTFARTRRDTEPVLLIRHAATVAPNWPKGDSKRSGHLPDRDPRGPVDPRRLRGNERVVADRVSRRRFLQPGFWVSAEGNESSPVS